MNKEEEIHLESFLSVRTTNILRENKIYFLSDLVNLSFKELISFKNIGKKSVDEIREYLAKQGLSLKDETVDPDIKKLILSDLPGVLNGIRNQVDEAMKELRYFRYKLDQITEETQKKKLK